MSYYWFNRQKLFQKTKDKYNCGGKEKAAEYYIKNKDVIKKKAYKESVRNREKRKKKIWTR